MLQNNKKRLIFFFVFFLSINCFSTQNLATLYETDDKELNIHLSGKIQSFLENIDDKKYPNIVSRNKLKVGLYAYNMNQSKWFFFENPFIYTSGWLTKDVLPNETYKSLASFYDIETDNQKLLKDLKDRKAKVSDSIVGNKIESKKFGNFLHSEQAFISDLQNRDGNIKIAEYNRFFLLFVSTNEVCNICGPTLTNLLNDDEYFLNGILKNFPYKKEIEKIRTTKKYKNESKTSINIFFESLFPETINEINFDVDDRKFLSHHSVLKLLEKKEEASEEERGKGISLPNLF